MWSVTTRNVTWSPADLFCCHKFLLPKYLSWSKAANWDLLSKWFSQTKPILWTFLLQKFIVKTFLKIVFRKSINSDPWVVKREYDQRRRKVKWIYWEMDCCFRLSCLESDHRLDHIIHFPCKQLGEMNYINPVLYDSVNVEVTGRRSRRRSVWATSSSETVDSLGGSLAVRWSNLPYKRRTRS